VTKDEIIKIAQKVTGVSFPLGIDGISIGMNEKHLQDFANVIAEIERKACSAVCLDLAKWHSETVMAAFESAADAIKARGSNDV
jgi:hypothetical protein